MNDQITFISLDKITPNKYNRLVGGFDPVKLEQLAASIREFGVQQPVIVRANGEGYELVAGERRWRASAIAGLPKIPCLIRDIDDLQMLKIRWIENLQRDDIHPLDEAEGYRQLLEKAGYEIDKLAQEIGKSASYVYQRLKLIELIEPVRKLLVENKITPGHAILIARLDDQQQKEILKNVLLNRWCDNGVCSVRDLSEWIQQHILLDLSKSTWKMDDSGLLPSAGACRDCKKRTGYNSQVFADVCKNQHDYCADKTCYKAKIDAVVDLRRKELKDEPHIEACQGYSELSKSQGSKGVYKNHEWNECKKNTPGAQRVLIVEGTSPGRLTYGKLIDYSTHREKTQEEKDEIKKLKQNRQEGVFIRRALFDQIVNKVNKVKAIKDISKDMLLFIVQIYWGRIMYEVQKEVALSEKWDMSKIEGSYYMDMIKIGEKNIKNLEVVDLIRLLVKFTISSELKIPQYGQVYDSDILLKAAKIFDIDVKSVKQSVRESTKKKSK